MLAGKTHAGTRGLVLPGAGAEAWEVVAGFFASGEGVGVWDVVACDVRLTPLVVPVRFIQHLSGG